jgi:hypothetical protein
MGHPSVVFRNALKGTLAGAFAGVVLICIGLVRALVVLLSGGRFKPLTSTDLRLLVFYVGGFALVGGLLGAARIHDRGRAIIVLGYVVGGVILMLAIVAGDDGSLSGMHGSDWLWLPALGALFGAAAAYGHLRRKP